MTTYCTNCIFFFDSDNPKTFPEGSYGSFDTCSSKEAPISDYVRGRRNPHLINDGACKFYLQKVKQEVESL